MVVGTAERNIQIFTLSNPTTPYKTMQSPLKWQTRVTSCFTASPSSGFAVGSIEGRVAIQWVFISVSIPGFLIVLQVC